MSDVYRPRPRSEDRPVSVEINDNMLRVTLQDGRIIATPLEWYPWLVIASPEQREHYELSLSGVHWPDLDEDLSVVGMLRGNRPRQPRQQREVEQ
jgi:hypothetical protein